MTTSLYLGLGGNLGDVNSHLTYARNRISELIGPVSAASSLYLTAAWGNTDQPPFINQVIRVETNMDASQILRICQQIELERQRERKQLWGPRTLDIDLLAYGQQVISSKELTLPHPGIPDRKFVLIPLQEIDPDWLHPTLKLSPAALLAQSKDTLPVSIITNKNMSQYNATPATPRIVYLDGRTLNPGDISYDPLKELGDVAIFEKTLTDQVVERAKGVQIILTNKTPITEEHLEQLPELQLIVVTATGYNIVDTEAARSKDVVVSNAAGYSTDSVAQHVFALLLSLIHRPEAHNLEIQKGKWQSNGDFSFQLAPWHELKHKVMGIYGYGTIGQRVSEIARVFGMKVISHTAHPEKYISEPVDFVGLKDLFSKSDIVSLHAPLTSDNKGLVNEELLKKMTNHAYLINTARGGLIVEEDLAKALNEGWIAGAGLDVLSQEPPADDNPLIRAKNCLITPHHAWASVESRKRLLKIVIDNIKAFLDGNPIQVVN